MEKAGLLTDDKLEAVEQVRLMLPADFDEKVSQQSVAVADVPKRLIDSSINTASTRSEMMESEQKENVYQVISGYLNGEPSLIALVGKTL